MLLSREFLRMLLSGEFWRDFMLRFRKIFKRAVRP
jgi:hypothetical protein